MLDIMRRQASSWIIKIIFSVIILSFIVFFGYTTFTNRYSRYNSLGQSQIAMVDGYPISRQKYEVLYQGSIQQFEKQVQGSDADKSIPESFKNLLKKNILDQLIMKESNEHFAKKLGLQVSDQALADEIAHNPNLAEDGHFNVSDYQNRFLPFYERKYGEDFEAALRKDMLNDQLNLLGNSLFAPWQAWLDADLQSHKTQKSGPQSGDVKSATTSSLLNLWADSFREKLKIDVIPSQ